MSQKIEIPLGNGLVLAAQKNFDPDYNEIFVWLEDEDGVFVQDIANIGQEYEYEKDLHTVLKDSFVVRVYGKPEDDDITEVISGIALNKTGKEIVSEYRCDGK